MPDGVTTPLVDIVATDGVALFQTPKVVRSLNVNVDPPTQALVGPVIGDTVGGVATLTVRVDVPGQPVPL